MRHPANPDGLNLYSVTQVRTLGQKFQNLFSTRNIIRSWKKASCFEPGWGTSAWTRGDSVGLCWLRKPLIHVDPVLQYCYSRDPGVPGHQVPKMPIYLFLICCLQKRTDSVNSFEPARSLPRRVIALDVQSGVRTIIRHWLFGRLNPETMGHLWGRLGSCTTASAPTHILKQQMKYILNRKNRIFKLTTNHNRPSQNNRNITVTTLCSLHSAFSEINIYYRPSQINTHTHITGLIELTHNVRVTTGLHNMNMTRCLYSR
jgi:hypothetical protein